MKNTKLKEGIQVKYTYNNNKKKGTKKIGGQRTDKLSPQILSVFPKDRQSESEN